MSKLNHTIEPEELMAYLDGELPAEKAFDTAAHLEQCDECRKLAAELKEVSEMLVAFEVEETKEGLPDGIASALADKGKDKPASLLLARLRFPTRRQIVWGGGLAATALLLFALTMPSFLRVPMSEKHMAQLSRALRNSTARVASRGAAFSDTTAKNWLRRRARQHRKT